MTVRDEAEGAEICERLRAVGIKCAVEPLPDVNSLASIWGGQAPDVLVVLVHERDIAKARDVIAKH
jgi:hypothetical protein